MARQRHLAPLFLVAMLSPALLQPVDCSSTPGETTLSSLTLEINGQNQLLGFTTSDREYDVWNPTGAPTAVLAATPTDLQARVTWSLNGAVGLVGIGGGSTTVDLPAGTSALVVIVRPPTGAPQSYRIDINPACDAGPSCDDGNECTDDAACDVANFLCPPPTLSSTSTVCNGNSFCDGAGECIPTVDPCESCDDGNDCTANMCDPADPICTHPNLPDFSTCDFGGQAGACVQGVCQRAETKSIPVACANNVTTAQDPISMDLTISTPTVLGGQAPQDFTASAKGTFVFPRFFMDASQGAVPGGISQAEVVDLVATVQVRSGATGPDIVLVPDVNAITPGGVTTCTIPSGLICNVDADCAGGFGQCNVPVTLIDFPTSTDCGAGGLCDQLGQNSQCTLNNFCITGDLEIPLAPASAAFTPGSSGAVLFGWADQNVPGLVTCPASAPDCEESFHVMGSYDLPPAVFSNPTGPFGIRFNSGGLFVPLQCAMAEPGGVCAGQTDLGCVTSEECGGSGPCDLTVADVIMPMPDAALIYVSIEEPDAVPCGGADCNDANPCTTDSCGTGDVCVNAPTGDGAPCTSGGLPGVCGLGACSSLCGLVVDCNDNEECTVDSCNPFDGRCENAPVPDLSSCDFGGIPGLCSSGACLGACSVLDCDDADDCTVDGCDSGLGACTNNPEPDGTTCDFGGLPGLCSSGICADAMLCAGVDCDDLNPCSDDVCDPQTGSCIHTPVVVQTACDFSGIPGLCFDDICVSTCDVLDCDDSDDCTDDVCDPFAGTCGNATSADGASCNAGLGECQSGVCQSVAPTFTTKTSNVSFDCFQALGGPATSGDFELTVSTTPIVGGDVPREFTAEISAVVPYPEAFLDELQTAIPGGIDVVSIDFLNATVWIRTGAESTPVTLPIDATLISVGTTSFCQFPSYQTCTVDTDCPGSNPCLPVDTLDIPTSSDCTPGGVCESLGKTGTGSQCDNNGFCVTGGIDIPVGVETQVYTSESQGVVVFSWKDDFGFVTYLTNPIAPQTIFCQVNGVPSSALPFFPIDSSGPIACGPLDCNDGLPCTTDSCELPAGTCSNIVSTSGTLCDFGGLPGGCGAGSCFAVCDVLDCDDANPCTADSCNPNDGLCDYVVLDGASCDLSGTAGVCVGSSCEEVCEVVGCDDENECTDDVCDLPTGNCSNIAAPDGTVCSFGGSPGICLSGQCEDAMLCAGADCDDGNVCTSDSCDPQTGLCINDPIAGSCNFGGLPGACVDGTCESECAITDCDDSEDCTDDICDQVSITCSNVTSPDDTFCDSGYGRCEAGVCTPIPAAEFSSQTQVVTVACSNSVTTEQTEHPYELTIRATPITGGVTPEPFAAEHSGYAVYPEFFLDAGQGAVPGGITQGELVELVATVQVRSGAIGPDVALGPDASAISPGAVMTCDIPAGLVCNDDLDCAGGFGECKIPRLLIDFPTSTDCAPGGACELIGKTGTGSQCQLNGFCITGDLLIPLGPEIGIYTPDPTGAVLFGWADQGVPGLVTCPGSASDCQEPFMPDGCYELPEAVFSDPVPPVGLRMNQFGLFVPLQCAGATAGGICGSGEGCIVDADCVTPPCTPTDDVVCPTQDAGLISFPIN